MRRSGILYPISSLPSPFGIGCFSEEAYDFVDFLKDAGQSIWQILPMGPTGYGDSPYQSLSTFAGNPYFISLDALIDDGLLERGEIDGEYFGGDARYADYGALYNNRFKVLRKAFDRFKNRETPDDYEAFAIKEAYWLNDYCLFMALKIKNDGKPWFEWDGEFRRYDAKAMASVREELADSIDFFRFQQYEFMKQWMRLHKYANEKGIRIMGDLPIYVALDSADAWANPSEFDFDAKMKPNAVAGCPPDAFSPTGQLWGNPLYNWEAMKRNGYRWWLMRMRRQTEFYDIIRIDHFRGFDEYYAVPSDDETAENGKWMKGPGRDLFDIMQKELGDVEIIAEDLGLITDSVRDLLKELGFPGMKVLQFAFDESENSAYLTYMHEKNAVVYTGTHDNMTTRGWIESISDHDRDFARRFINSIFTDYGQFTWDFIREAMRSSADTCIIPIQDYLVYGNEARMNEPSRAMGNWQWRTVKGELKEDLAKAVYEMTKLYGRLPKEITSDEESNQ